MSQTLWILEEGQESDTWDHTLVLEQIEVIDTYCIEKGYMPLSSFLDESIVAEEFGMDLPPKYVAPEDIITLFEALSDFGDKGLQEELKDILTKVKQAHHNGLKIRLALVS
jgi:hypothetical protein